MIRITHFMRDPRPNTFSIERLYEDVRNALPQDCNAEKWVCRNPSQGFWPRLRDAWAARKAQGDVNHVTGDTHYLTFFLNKHRTVLTVHDLVAFERSNGLKRLIFWFFWFWLPVVRSKMVVTVSEATRQALLKAVRCNPNKVVVIHNPVSEEFKPSHKAFTSDYPRILQVGTTPNKNLHRVAEALAGLPCKLVIIGLLRPEVKTLLLKYQIDYENHSGLSRESLLREYIKADMLVFASTYEGFGLPIIEANGVGRPVLTSNISPMSEVAMDAACLVDPYSVSSITEGVRKIIEESSYRKALVDAGYRNATRFSASLVAKNYAELYRRVAQ